MSLINCPSKKGQTSKYGTHFRPTALQKFILMQSSYPECKKQQKCLLEKELKSR